MSEKLSNTPSSPNTQKSGSGSSSGSSPVTAARDSTATKVANVLNGKK